MAEGSTREDELDVAFQEGGYGNERRPLACSVSLFMQLWS